MAKKTTKTKRAAKGSTARGKASADAAGGLTVDTKAMTTAVKKIKAALTKTGAKGKAKNQEDLDAAIDSIDTLLDAVGCQGTSMTRTF